MKYQYHSLLVSIADRIAFVMYNHNGSLNILSDEIKQNLADFFTQARFDDRIRAIVLTGKGRTFFLGGDLFTDTPVNTAAGQENAPAKGSEDLNLAEIIRNTGKPVIAAVNGYAIGAGMKLVAASHMVIAAEDARFCEILSVKKAGMDGKETILPDRSAVYEGSYAWRYQTISMTAEEAHQAGIVSKVVAREELIEQAIAAAKKIVKSPNGNFDAARRQTIAGNYA